MCTAHGGGNAGNSSALFFVINGNSAEVPSVLNHPLASIGALWYGRWCGSVDDLNFVFLNLQIYVPHGTLCLRIENDFCCHSSFQKQTPEILSPNRIFASFILHSPLQNLRATHSAGHATETVFQRFSFSTWYFFFPKWNPNHEALFWLYLKCSVYLLNYLFTWHQYSFW